MKKLVAASYGEQNDELVNASKEGHVETVKLLLAKGADVNVKTADGQTALKMATQKGSSEIIRLIKQAGVKE